MLLASTRSEENQSEAHWGDWQSGISSRTCTADGERVRNLTAAPAGGKTCYCVKVVAQHFPTAPRNTSER